MIVLELVVFSFANELCARPAYILLRIRRLGKIGQHTSIFQNDFCQEPSQPIQRTNARSRELTSPHLKACAGPTP